MARRRRLADLAPAVAAAAAKALYQEANEIINESQRLVPVDTGTLKASARVLEPVTDGDHIVVRAGYGYGDAYEEKARSEDASGPGYAVYTHEILTNHHTPPTQAKFLETPALQHKTTFAGRIALEIRRALRGRQAA